MKEKYFYYSQNFNYPVFPFLPFFDRLFYFYILFVFNKYIFYKDLSQFFYLWILFPIIFFYLTQGSIFIIYLRRIINNDKIWTKLK